MQRALRRWGYQVEQAWNGEEALRLFQEGTFDLVLIDWNLPGRLSGLDLCRRLRALSPTTGLCFLTGRQDDEDKIAGLNAANCNPQTDGDIPTGSTTGNRDSYNVYDFSEFIPGSQTIERVLNCVDGAGD